MVIKKSIGVLVSLIAMCVIGCFTVYAEDDATVESTVTEQALSWCETVYSDVDFEVKDIIPIVDNEGNVYAFSASVWSGDIPYGYVNVDLTLDFPVYDYLLSEGESSLFNSLADKAGLLLDNVSPLLISDNSLDYYVLDYKKNIYNSEGTMVDSSSVFDVDHMLASHKEYEYDFSIMYGFISKKEYDIVKLKDLKNVTLYSREYVENQTGKYACSVSALTTIAYCCKATKSCFKDTYNAIWKATHTFCVDKKSKNGIQYGETLNLFISKGMEKYISSVGKVCKTISQKKPKSSFFRTAIDVNHPCLLCYWIRVKDKNKSGHTVFVNGYVVAKEKSTGKTKYFLKISDGWTNKYRYINYTDVDLIDAYGYDFSIQN